MLGGVGERRYFLGGMSGTSADGVDVAVLAVYTDDKWDNVQYDTLHHEFVPFAAELQKDIFAIRGGDAVTIAHISGICRRISDIYIEAGALALKNSGLTASSITAYGVHGQTIYHAPPETWQMIDAPRIAAALQVDVVFNFRQADTAAGGQGAPLVPFLDYITFGKNNLKGSIVNETCAVACDVDYDTRPREETASAVIARNDTVPSTAATVHSVNSAHTVKPNKITHTADDSKCVGKIVVNLGGIANITVIPPRASAGDILAFDTGPANCIIDAIMRKEGGAAFDEGGKLAATGAVHEGVVAACLADAYMQRLPPKSTDITQMLHIFQHVMTHLDVTLSFADALRTAVEITARSLVQGMVAAVGLTHAEECGWDVILSGGGVNNETLMESIKSHVNAALPGRVSSFQVSDRLGLPSAAKEAAAFAMLAAAFVDGIPSNVPSCTGARYPVVCGCLAPNPMKQTAAKVV